MTIYRDDLERVYALIEKPENWIQREFARTKFNERVPARHEEACKWCLFGAFERVLPIGADLEDFHAYTGMSGSVMEFNDTRTHAEVLQLLRDAIDRAPVRS